LTRFGETKYLDKKENTSKNLKNPNGYPALIHI
jgi:hypothetical protein